MQHSLCLCGVFHRLTGLVVFAVGGATSASSCTQKRIKAWGGRLECGGEWAAKTVKRPLHQLTQPLVCQLLGSADAEMTSIGTPAAAAVRTQQPNVAREGKNG